VALQLDYVVRETSTNLRRNVTLNIAAVVTMAVSLCMFGSAMVLRAAVGNLSTRWAEGVEVVVFVNRDISQADQDTLQDDLDAHPEVAKTRYMDSDASLEEYKRIFRNNPAMLAEADKDPDLVPNSFRITPQTDDPDAIIAMTRTFGAWAEDGKPVLKAVSALEGVRRLQHFSTLIQRGILVVALGLLMAALLLILNAIRMAMFARRREIEVMKLVGATNWFIRIPFMMEGVVQGMVGSAFAVIGVYILDKLMYNVGTDAMSVFSGMVATRGEVNLVMFLVVVLGVGIGAVGSGWALSRFLKV
jgi:cell division transport system permease protein